MTPSRSSQDSFFNLHTHGFVRGAVAVPRVQIGDPEANLAHTLKLIRDLSSQSPSLIVFPELGLSAYAIDDLVQQTSLLNGVEENLCRLLEATHDISSLIFVGAPVRAGDRLYNTALALHKGRLLAGFPKTYLPNYREFYEKRHFSSGAYFVPNTLMLAGQEVPFGSDVLLCADDLPGFVVHAEICEDVWAPIPPSTYAALAGARILVNLSASNVTVGKSAYRHALAEVHSARCLAAYLYSASGHGESTTDLAWDGQAMIYENGHLLAESQRFLRQPQYIIADIDLERLGQERLRQTSFNDAGDIHLPYHPFREVRFSLGIDRENDQGLKRTVSRFPYLPKSEKHLSKLCYETYNIQSQGLCQRLESSGLKHIVLGVSGGLDSTHALLVAAHAFDALGFPRKNILAYSLPTFGTSTRTRTNAWMLMEKLGVTTTEIDLTGACERMLLDIGHPAARGEKVYDATFENVQAGARTSLLFRLANLHHGLVLGTGDLSELALGWCTYGVGDQMAHYNVNASVPKTLIQHLIHWVATHEPFGDSISALLHDILDTDISPELIPVFEGSGSTQRTEEIIGPYSLQDFTLFYTTRHGFSPVKIAFLAYHAWRNTNEGIWPPNIPEHHRVAYDLPTIKKWLQVFIRRFFAESQFKRSALPNGPKVSSGGSLSPRGDWRAPSDGNAALWLADCKRIPEA
jgi:NAD+ synthase (glutamine-hydrolysing)